MFYLKIDNYNEQLFDPQHCIIYIYNNVSQELHVKSIQCKNDYILISKGSKATEDFRYMQERYC